jgi:hypothetical protein
MPKTHFFHLSILTGIFVLVNGLWFWKMGVMTDDDTWGYLQYADEIRENGLFFKPHLFWYIGYVLFILGANSFIPGLGGVVFFQYVLAYIALIALYFAAINLYQNPKAALLTGIWFLGFIMISFWNLFLYAESLMISLYCISFFFLTTWYQKKVTLWNVIIGVLVLAWAVLTKPTGLGILVAVMAVGIYWFFKQGYSKTVKWAFSVVLVVCFLGLTNKMLATFGFVRDYQVGEVVYNIHKLAHEDYAKPLLLQVPEDLFIPEEGKAPLVKLFQIVVFNPWYSLKLFGTKFFYYLFYIRPYYSWTHNVLALAVLLPMYYGFVKSMTGKMLKPEVKIFALTFIAFSAFSVSLLTINWNARFLMPVLPLVFLVGGNVLVGKLGEIRLKTQDVRHKT